MSYEKKLDQVSNIVNVDPPRADISPEVIEARQGVRADDRAIELRADHEPVVPES